METLTHSYGTDATTETPVPYRGFNMASEFHITEHQIELDNVSINYAAGPKAGPPMVMLHGTTSSWQSFDTVMPALGSQFTVHASDFRGHGQSGRVAGGYRLSEFAKDTIALLKACFEEPAILVGHSMGAVIAIEVAAIAPEAVKAIILEEPNLYAYRGERLRAWAFFPFLEGFGQIASAGGSVDEMLPKLAELLNEPDQEALRGRAEQIHMMDPDVMKMYIDGTATDDYEIDVFLRGVNCPALLLRGEPALGSAISDDDVALASTHLSGGTVIPMPGIGHMMHKDKPQEFCEMVVRFLDNL